MNQNNLDMIMQFIRSRNPQAYQRFQSLKHNNGDPTKMINDIVGKFTPEQMGKFQQFANGFGITNQQLANFGINTK